MKQGVMALLQSLERNSNNSLPVPSSSCSSEQDVTMLLCTTFNGGEGKLQSQKRREPSDGKAVVPPQTSSKAHHENGLLGSPSVRPSPKAIDFARTGSSGHSPRATGPSQKSAGCECCVHQICRTRSGVQKGRTLPLR